MALVSLPLYGIAEHITDNTAIKSVLKSFMADAEKGDPEAQLNLGGLYSFGMSVPKDYAEAMKWYRKAAEQGNAVALYSIGGMYAEGQGVPQDYAEAYFWLNLAAAKSSNKDIIVLRDITAKKLTPAVLNDVQQRARNWQPYIAE